MRTLVATITALLLLAPGCGGPQTPAKAGPDEAAPAQQAAADPQKAKPAPPPAADISDEVLVTFHFTSLDTALDIGTKLVQPQLPPPLQGMADPTMLKAQVFSFLRKETRLDNLDKVLDTSRAVALALVDPKVNGGRKLQPWLIGLPVQDQTAMIDLLGQLTERHEAAADGHHVFVRGRYTIHLRFKDNFALIASSEKLIGGAEKVLMPLLTSPPEKLARVSVDMETIYQRFGKEIDRALAKAKRELDRSSRDTGGMGMEMVQRWMGYVTGLKEIFVEGNIVGDKLWLNVGGEAKAGSKLEERLGQLNAGEVWGAKYLPADAALMAVGRENPKLRQESVDEAIGALVTVLKPYVPEETVRKWGAMATEASKHYGGESAMAMWATADGGVGMGGVTKLTDGDKAQQELRKWLQFFGAEIKRLQNKVFKKELQKELPGAGLAMRLKKNALRAGKLRGDLVELSVKWPRVKSKRDRKQLAEAKKIMRTLVGPKLTMAYLVTGDKALFTMGKDYRKRMVKMAALVQGDKASGVEQKMAPYAQNKKVVALVYMPVDAMAEQVLRVANQVTTIPPDVREVVKKVMPGPNVEVPVVAVMHVDGAKAAWETNVSANVVGMIGRGVMHFMSSRGGMKAMP